jgi:hypothetical protein
MALNLPVDMAYEWGHHRAAAPGPDGRGPRLEAMNDTITALPDEESNLRHQLEQVKGNAVRFGRIARRAGTRPRIEPSSFLPRR